MATNVTVMELIQIISRILLVGGALLTIVISISFLLSKRKKKMVRNSIAVVPSVVLNSRNQTAYNQEQKIYRRNSAPQAPVVYQLDPVGNRDIRILRKPTVTKREIQERIKQDENSFKRTNGLRKRYTIINDEMKKSFKPNVINF